MSFLAEADAEASLLALEFLLPCSLALWSTIFSCRVEKKKG